MLDTRFFTFLVLCQTKSFTKTAEELHITQPAVSHHIKYLEEYYNVKLYTYVGKKFHLTTSGEVLYQFVSSFYTDSERIKEQLRQSNSAFRHAAPGGRAVCRRIFSALFDYFIFGKKS